METLHAQLTACTGERAVGAGVLGEEGSGPGGHVADQIVARAGFRFAARVAFAADLLTAKDPSSDPWALLPEMDPPALLHAAPLGPEDPGGRGEQPRERGTVARVQPLARQTGTVGGTEEGLDGVQAERADVGRAGGRPGIAAGRGARGPDDGGDEQRAREPQLRRRASLP